MKIFLMPFIAFSFLFSVPVFAGIRDVGNGGDAIVLEFMNLGRQVAKDIRLEAEQLFPEFAIDELEDALARTKVVSVERALLNGVEKDAINYPRQKLIEVSSTRWLARTRSPEQQQALVFHEYLGIMGVDDGDFSVSGRLLDYYFNTKKRIIDSELVGRIYITDQDDFATQGLIVITTYGQITFTGTVQNQNLSCSGTYKFNGNQQLLDSKLRCGNSTARLEINFWDTDIVDFLRNGLVGVDFSFTQPTSSSGSAIKFKKQIDAKKLR